jgi:hypothetical protein
LRITIMKCWAIVGAILLGACSGDNRSSTTSALRPPGVPVRALSGISEPIDPPDTNLTPITIHIAQINKIIDPSGYTYVFQVTGSGVSSGNYHVDWMVKTCDMNDYCHDDALWTSSESPSDTAQVWLSSETAWARVRAMGREVGSSNYYTTTSNQLRVKGPAWGQFPDGGSIGGTCFSSTFPLAEQYRDTTGVYRVRNYSRNVCTGHKEYAP